MEEIIRLKANYLGDGQHKIICPSCNQTRKKKNQKNVTQTVTCETKNIKKQKRHTNGDSTL